MTIVDVIKRNDDLWFITKEYAGVFHYSFLNNKLELVYCFDEYPFYSQEVVSKIDIVDNCLICAPGKGKIFYFIDINMNECIYKKVIDTNDVCLNGLIENKYLSSYVTNNVAYFVGYTKLDIVEIDCSFKTFKSYSIKDCLEKNGYYNVRRISEFGDFQGDKIYFPIIDCNCYVIFDVHNKNIQVKKIAQTEKTFGITLSDNKLIAYMLCNNKILCISDHGCEDILYSKDVFLNYKNRGIGRVVHNEDGTFLFPYRGKWILKLNEKEMKMDKYLPACISEIAYLNAGVLSKDVIWAFNRSTGLLEIINTKLQDRQCILFEETDEILKHINTKDVFQDLQFENKGFGLALMLKILN